MAYVDYNTFVETEKTSGNSDGIGFFTLKDGEEAIVRIMCDSINELDILTVHPITVGNSTFPNRQVNCLRDPREPLEQCPLCSAGNKVKQKVFDESPCNYKYTKLSDNKKEDIKSKIMIQNAKVLIVDDNRINLKVASGLLKRLGVETILAESGKEAINLLKNGEKYDIVFMDYYMPEMDGIETTKIIRTIDDYCKNELIVVALTANAVEDAKEEFFEAGINDYLIKPIVPLRLNEILTKWLPNEKVIVE